MLRNSLKIALRHLWRNRFYTALHILGLSIGLSTAWIIFRVVSYEFSFDQQHPDKDRIFRIVSHSKTEGQESGITGVSLPLIQAVRTQIPGIDVAAPIFREWTNVLVPQPKGEPTLFLEPKDMIFTDGNYFRIFPHTWVAGVAVSDNPNTVLKRPNEVILCQSRAKEYFPELRPDQVIGHTLTYFDSVAVTVTGVVADFPYLSSFNNKEFLSLATLRLPAPTENLWSFINSNQQVLIKLTPGADPLRVQQQISNLSARKLAALQLPQTASNARWHLLQPLTDVHFGIDYQEPMVHTDRTVLYKLIGLALFMVLLAVINYINLSTAQLPERAREIGIRKVLGSRSRSLTGQFMGETLIVMTLALGLSFVLTEYILLLYGHFMPNGSIDYYDWQQIGLFLVGLLLLVSVLSGWYPAWLMTRFQPVTILRGQTLWAATPRFPLRKSLIVLQLAIAQAFIFGAILIRQQLQFALHHDMGFEHETVVTTGIYDQWHSPIKDLSAKETLRAQIAQIPGVSAVSLGSLPADDNRRTSFWAFTGKQGKVSFEIDAKFVDTSYLSLYRIPLLAGRNFRSSHTVSEVIINEAAVKAMGLSSPEEAIGRLVPENNSNPVPIVGVVRNFHTASLHEKIPPLFLAMDKNGFDHLSIQLAAKNPADWSTTLARIEQCWKRIYTESDFGPFLYEKGIELFYQKEQTISTVIDLATGVAILIACLGLFGLATLTAHQRNKEIGIRKVLGASITSIVAMLSSDFIKLILLAIGIALPLAWYIMSQWLQNFAYKTDIAWWMFALAGLLATGIALLTVSFQSVKAALMNPVKSLRAD